MADSADRTTKDWADLTELTRGTRNLVIERVALRDKGIAIEGAFELPQLARLAADDQIFVVAFLRSHGSIKEMEQIFGVSYPTIKARLTRIADSLEFVETDARPTRGEILADLKRGAITADEALRRLEELR